MRRIALCLIASLSLWALLALRSYSEEPTHEGKTLTQWAAAYLEAEPDTNDLAEADLALRSMGTPVVPHLLEWGDSDDWTWRRRSWMGFRALGPAGAEAIPTLAKRLEGTNDSYAAAAARSLAGIGAPALPALVNAITNRHSTIHTYAIARIELDPNASHILPWVIHDLESSNKYYRWRAAQAAGSLHIEADRVVPKLSYLLQDKEPSVRFSSVQALERFGPFAAPAIPEVSKLLTDASPSIRWQATNTLRSISGAIISISSPFHP
jgi:HEAT repeat protein